MVERPLTEYLNRLQADQGLLAAYREDPRSVLRESGLSEEKQELLMANDRAQIQAALEAEHPEVAAEYVNLFLR